MAGVSLLPKFIYSMWFSSQQESALQRFLQLFEKCSDMIISLAKLTILQGRRLSYGRKIIWD